MHRLGGFMVVLLGLLALPPTAAQTGHPLGDACQSPTPGRRTVAACNRYIEVLNDAIRVVESGKLKAKGTDHPGLYVLRGTAYQAIARHHAANEEARKAKDIELRAIGDFDKAIGLDATFPDAYINRGRSWVRLAERDRAFRDFDRALHLDPRNARALNNRGATYLDKGDIGGALSDFDRAIALKPNLAFAYFNRGAVHLQRKDYDRAIGDYTGAMRHGLRSILTLAVRGLAWRNKGGNDRLAKVDFEAALRRRARDKSDRRLQASVRELLRALQEKIDRDERERRQKVEAERNKKVAVPPPEPVQPPAPLIKEAKRPPAHEGKKPPNVEAGRDKKVAILPPKLVQPPAPLIKEAKRPPAHEGKKPPNVEAGRDKVAILPPKLVQPPAPLAKDAKHAPMVARPKRPEGCPAAIDGPSVPAESDRIALVIGNTAYAKPFDLPNARNDAEGMAKTLRGLDFAVFLGIDCTHAQMVDLLERFAHAAQNAPIALFFFAGHGLQQEGVNYLASVDATDWSNVARFVTLQFVIGRLQAGRDRLRIMIIDACRSGLPNLKRGFAKETNVPAGMFVAFATLANKDAYDGVRDNSPFTEALMRYMPTPGLELRHLIVRVNSELDIVTRSVEDPEGQTPQTWDTSGNLFYFNRPG